jgi:PAS domain S-box-containing protein
MNVECPDIEDFDCLDVKRNHSFLLEAMEAISDAFYMLDMNWRFTFINRAAEEFFHTPRETAIGNFYTEVWPEVRGSELFQVLTRVFAHGERVEVEIPSARRPDRLVALSAVPLSSGGAAVTVKDITHRIEHQQQLEEAQLRLTSMLESTSDNVVMLDRDGVIQFANARAKQTIGWGTDVVGQSLDVVVPTLAKSPLKHMLAQSLESQTGNSFVHHSNSLNRWFDITLYPSESGVAIFYKDITYQRKNEEKLAASERQFRELSESMPQFVWKADRGGNRMWFNRRWIDYTGMPLRASRGWGWLAAHHPDDHEDIKRTLVESLRDKKSWEGNWRIMGRDGVYRWYLTRCLPVFDIRGNITHWIGTSTDITTSVKDKDHQELLLHELNHRVKNTLAIIQSIGRQTTGDNMPEYRRLFENRLLALSKTHDLLTESNWASAPLRELVVSELAPYVDPKAQRVPYTLLGPDIKLKPQVVVPLGMALHELATNAVKYGSLSNDDGHVVINWNIDDDGPRTLVRILWIESDGPPVLQPTRKGFGTRLMRHSFQGDFGGSVQLAYLPEGFQCVMEIPAEHLVDSTTERMLFRIKKAAQ